jgi:hypothetical protein
LIITYSRSLYSVLLLITILVVTAPRILAQQKAENRLNLLSFSVDSILATEDSAVYYSIFASKRNKVHDKYNSLSYLSKEAMLALSNSNTEQLFSRSSKSFIHIHGGFSSYAMNYRSIIDTPFAERNIIQHNLSGQVNFIAGNIPLQVTYLVRRSNSDFFRNIQDVQMALDPMGLRMLMQNRLQKQLITIASTLDDSLTEKLLDLKLQDLAFTEEWLKGQFQIQRVIEANEIIKVPGLSYRPSNSTEQNQQREDSLKLRAERFLSLYKRIDSVHTVLKGQVDSLRSAYTFATNQARQFRELSNGNLTTYRGYQQFRDSLDKKGLPDVNMPAGFERLLAIRTFSVGRSPLQYSELTAKNISINGVNFEYNSWYYAAFSAGLVDFRFRDFAIGRNIQKQYLVMARAGIGNLDNHYFILSAFKGYKQLYAASSGAASLKGIYINGYAAEAKWKLNRSSYLTGEVAESISPDFRSHDLSVKTKFSLKDHSNKAFAIKLSSLIPQTGSRVEGLYKFTGANYQSFSSFQTNASLISWHLKADQNIWNRMIKLSAGIRKNDFTNPYIVQNYSSNTLFKTFNAAFRKRGWPTISLGYMPMSQLTMIDDQVSENRFQTLNANLYHYYSVAKTRTASTMMVNKFFNHSSDSGFVYYNATNIYLAQNIFLGSMVASIAVSDTRNPQFQTQVFDESLQFNFKQSSSLLLGVKINNFNKQEVKVGSYISSSIRIWNSDMLYFSYERGYLPGVSKQPVKNDLATIQFTKVFGTVKQYSTNNTL